MVKIPKEAVDSYRMQTFRIDPSLRLKSPDDAIDFVNERGFIYFWPIKGIVYPSLWVAKAGNRPVAENHDDPGHVTWQWKDRLLAKRVWYYGKILRKKATIISLEVLPCFYALSENFGSPEEDYLTLYEQGQLTVEAKTIYEVLLKQGAQDTISLRKASHLSSFSNESRFNKAITDLQADFKITPIGVCEAGGWNYAFVYEISTRAFPDIQNKSRFISDEAARKTLLSHYFKALGVSKLSDAQKLFQWSHKEIEFAIQSLVDEGFLSTDISIENDHSNMYCIASMLK